LGLHVLRAQLKVHQL